MGSGGLVVSLEMSHVFVFFVRRAHDASAKFWVLRWIIMGAPANFGGALESSRKCRASPPSGHVEPEAEHLGTLKAGMLGVIRLAQSSPMLRQAQTRLSETPKHPT